MKILLIGGNGRIGRRYAAILNWLKIPYGIYDPKNSDEPDIMDHDKWIICSPTDTHYEWCMTAVISKKPFLCEKPLSKSLDECKEIAKLCEESKSEAYLVCNYKYTLKSNLSWHLKRKISLSYDYFNPGDELHWSCAQLLLLDKNAQLNQKSPTWKFKINDSLVSYYDLEQSYIKMLQDFIEGKYEQLWPIHKGIEMTENVLRRIDAQSQHNNPS